MGFRVKIRIKVGIQGLTLTHLTSLTYTCGVAANYTRCNSPAYLEEEAQEQRVACCCAKCTMAQAYMD
jgi:hypothetical protein